MIRAFGGGAVARTLRIGEHIIDRRQCLRARGGGSVSPRHRWRSRGACRCGTHAARACASGKSAPRSRGGCVCSLSKWSDEQATPDARPETQTPWAAAPTYPSSRGPPPLLHHAARLRAAPSRPSLSPPRYGAAIEIQTVRAPHHTVQHPPTQPLPPLPPNSPNPPHTPAHSHTALVPVTALPPRALLQGTCCRRTERSVDFWLVPTGDSRPRPMHTE